MTTDTETPTRMSRQELVAHVLETIREDPEKRDQLLAEVYATCATIEEMLAELNGHLVKLAEDPGAVLRGMFGGGRRRRKRRADEDGQEQ